MAIRLIAGGHLWLKGDFAIPTLGTFTARVFFYGNRYAGTWQHDKVGGHMFGRIEKLQRSS
jgi:hypothetical protein